MSVVVSETDPKKPNRARANDGAGVCIFGPAISVGEKPVGAYERADDAEEGRQDQACHDGPLWGAAISASNHLSSAIRMARSASTSSAKTGRGGRAEKRRASSDFTTTPFGWGRHSQAMFQLDFAGCYKMLLTIGPFGPGTC